MSLAIKYESVEDARMRLRHTVVRYKGTPVYINEVQQAPPGQGEIFRVLFTELPMTAGKGRDPFARRPIPAVAPAEDVQRKYISSKHFDISPFKMGYVNSPKGAFYCSRLPNRIQKQGLCGENFVGRTNKGTPVDFRRFLDTKEVVEMANNLYPTFDRAKNMLDKVNDIAFSRDFCLSKDEVLPELVYLYHKGNKVGYINEGMVTLGKKFDCLKESLAELGVR